MNSESPSLFSQERVFKILQNEPPSEETIRLARRVLVADLAKHLVHFDGAIHPYTSFATLCGPRAAYLVQEAVRDAVQQAAKEFEEKESARPIFVDTLETAGIPEAVIDLCERTVKFYGAETTTEGSTLHFAHFSRYFDRLVASEGLTVAETHLAFQQEMGISADLESLAAAVLYVAFQSREMGVTSDTATELATISLG